MAKKAAVIHDTTPITALAIDAGGGAIGNWGADKDYTASSHTATVASVINTSLESDPAPQGVYQTQRWARNLSYILPGLTPNAPYTVRLDFVESYWNGPGKRLFNILINGTRVAASFDIFAIAGGKNIAVAQTFTATADASGVIAVNMNATVDNASIAAIQVSNGSAGVPTPIPSAAPQPAQALSTIRGVVTDDNFGDTLPIWNSYVGCNAQAVETYTPTGSSDDSIYSNTSDIPWLISRYPAKTPLIFSMDIVAQTTTLAGVAAGVANSYFISWAQTILAEATPLPDGNFYIRIGYEEGNNGSFAWQQQGNTHPGTFIAAFQQFANAFHAVSPKFKIVWDTFPTATPIAAQTNAVYYPGDAYVDVISQDPYLQTSTGQNMSTALTRPNGLNWMASFATAHNKPMAFSEWAFDSNDAGPVITDYFNWIKANNLVYEVYYNAWAGGKLDNNQFPALETTFAQDYCGH